MGGRVAGPRKEQDRWKGQARGKADREWKRGKAGRGVGAIGLISDTLSHPYAHFYTLWLVHEQPFVEICKLFDQTSCFALYCD